MDEWKLDTHYNYTLLRNQRLKGIIDDRIFKLLEKSTPQEHYTRNIDGMYQSIVYPIYGKYEAYNGFDEPERFDTLEEAKEYFN